MKTDYLKYAIENIKHKPMRSWLTVLSILIGIMAIFALVSFGQGLSSYVNTLSAQMGTDKLMVTSKGFSAPGTDQNFFISDKDIDAIKKVNGIAEIAGLHVHALEIDYNKQKKYSFGMGMPMGSERKMIDEMLTVSIDKGRDLKSGDILNAVFGYNYQFADKIFKKALKVGDVVKINGYDVKIAGFYQAIGNPQDDANVYLTKEGFEFLYPDLTDKFQEAIARVQPDQDAAAIAEKATEKLRKFRGEKAGQEDFFIQTFQQAVETFMIIINVINGVLVLIALISLVVAAVNITNTMYTAVVERTKEIGVMKAVGAKNSDIMMMFVFEAGLFGFVGGALGIFMGYIVASLGGVIAANAGYPILKPIFPLWLIIGCLTFSFLVGSIAGLLPAMQASKLKPVDALRYE
ncbi:MAG: ABC transporter permease [Candidatus Woesearchaeota archaeon]|nr:ABC transporter permease [Candidatus Woesearchaeota archaeon]